MLLYLSMPFDYSVSFITGYISCDVNAGEYTPHETEVVVTNWGLPSVRAAADQDCHRLIPLLRRFAEMRAGTWFDRRVTYTFNKRTWLFSTNPMREINRDSIN